MTLAKEDDYVCDFCGKHKDFVSKMIVGLNDTVICDACVDACKNIVDDKRAKERAGRDEG